MTELDRGKFLKETLAAGTLSEGCRSDKETKNPVPHIPIKAHTFNEPEKRSQFNLSPDFFPLSAFYFIRFSWNVMMMKLSLILFTLIFFAAGCDRSSADPAENININSQNLPVSTDGQSEALKFKVETVAESLEVPWSMVFLPGGNILFTEREGRVRIIEDGKLRSAPIFIVSDVEAGGESGLMDITLHPDFAGNGFIYLAYAYDNNGKFDRVVRYKFDGKSFLEPKTIIENIPAAQYHAGMRAEFGPDGKLYITTGDATERQLAQQLDSLAGKTLRLNDDGSVPPDNPFIDQKGARPEIWSYGHRNAQGIAWQPETGLMFQTEHGPSGFDGPGGGDEVNIVERGKNYGWPVIHHEQSRDGMVSPLLEYTPACAPASALFYRGSAFPEFKGSFFFGCLRGEKIIRVTLNGRKVIGQEDLLKGVYGRIREVAEGPDGFIYFTTSNRDGRGSPAGNDDRIFRFVPAK